MTALRELLARFTVEVDPEGNLPKGNRQVDALRDKLEAVDAVAAGMSGFRAFSEALGTVRGLLGTGGAGAIPGLVKWNQALAAQEHGLVRVGASLPDFAAGIGKLSDYFPQATRAGSGLAGVIAERLRGAFDSARESLNRPRLGFLSGLANMNNLLAATGVALAARGLFMFADSTIKAAASVNDMAQRLGVTTDQFQELQGLAQLGGASIQDVGTAFTALTRNAQAFAATGQGEAAEAIQKLGLQLKDSNGQLRPAIDLFFDAGDALNALDNATLKQAYSQKLLGESGSKLFPVFNDLARMTAEQRAEVRALSIVYGEDFIQASAEADDKMLIAGKVLEGLKAKFVGALLPAIIAGTEALTSFSKWLGEVTKGLSLGRIAFVGAALALSPYIAKLSALVSLGGGWTKTMAGMARGFGGLLKSVAPLVAAFLVLEDVLVFFAGGKSTTGRLLDKIFGAGTGKGVQKTIEDLTAAFKDLWNWILGNGAGDKARALYREIIDGIDLLVHDLLVNLGIRDAETGLAGLNDFKAGKRSPSEQARAQTFFDPGTGAFVPIPALAGERQGTTVIDNSTRSVTMQMQPGASPQQNADAVSKRLEADRASIAARVP